MKIRGSNIVKQFILIVLLTFSAITTSSATTYTTFADTDLEGISPMLANPYFGDIAFDGCNGIGCGVDGVISVQFPNSMFGNNTLGLASFQHNFSTDGTLDGFVTDFNNFFNTSWISGENTGAGSPIIGQENVIDTATRAQEIFGFENGLQPDTLSLDPNAPAFTNNFQANNTFSFSGIQFIAANGSVTNVLPGGGYYITPDLITGPIRDSVANVFSDPSLFNPAILPQNVVINHLTNLIQLAEASGTDWTYLDLSFFQSFTDVADGLIIRDPNGDPILDDDGMEQPFPDLESFGISSFVSTEPGAAPIPIPAAVWLFGTALIGMFGISRRRDIFK